MDELEGLAVRKGNTAKIYKLKSIVVGRKKTTQEPTAIKSPETGEVITEPSKIKKESVKFCKNLLTNQQPKPNFKEDVEAKSLLDKISIFFYVLEGMSLPKYIYC